MQRGDAKPRRAARLTTTANPEPLERAGCARAPLARSAVPEPLAKAQLSLAEPNHGGSMQLACAEMLERLVRFFEAELSDCRAHGDLWSELQEFLAVMAGEVCDRTQYSLTPEQVVRERRNLARMDSGADDGTTFGDCRQGGRNELAHRREDDRGIEFFRRPIG